MSIPSDPPTAFAPLFDVERGRLLGLLRSMEPDDWSRPTPCPDWTILGLSTHILGVDLALLSRTRDGHHDTAAPQGLDETGFIAWLDELQAGWVTAAGRLSPRIVTELLAWSGPQVSEMVSEQNPTERTAIVSWAGSEPVPVWLDQCRELSECWIHRQQLLEALGQPADLRPDVAAVVLDGLKWAYPHRLSALERPVGTTVVIEITGHGLDADWSLTRTPEGWEQRREATRRPEAGLTMTADEAWRLLTNNLGAAERRRLLTSGDPEILAVLAETRAIIGAPN